MNEIEEHPTNFPVRASDAERDEVDAQLRHHYSVGRLTLPELEERVAAACQARTRDELDALMADLPTELKAAPPTDEIDTRLLIILLCTAPPAALVYWLIYYLRDRSL